MDVESIRITWKPHKYTTQLIFFLRSKAFGLKSWGYRFTSSSFIKVYNEKKGFKINF